MSDGLYTCVVCGAQVSKRQSAYYQHSVSGKDGRACRTHPEVQQYLTAKQQADIEAHKRATNSSLHPHTHTMEELRTQPEEFKKELLFMDTACWICGAIGVPAEHWPQYMLIGMEKLKQNGIPLDFLNMHEQVAKVLKIDNLPVLKLLWFQKLPPIKNDTKHKLMRVWHHIHGTVRCCIECAKCHGIDVEELAKQELARSEALSKVPLETMLAVGAAYETSELKTDLGRIAAELPD